MSLRKVDFFIAGVQKSGSTALDTFLRSHPQIQMARQKEVHHFDDDDLDWSKPDHIKLNAQFDWTAEAVVRGEATPIYSYWPNALERLRTYNPAAKIIVLLRHPSFRAHSHWRMETKRGNDTLPFAETIGAAGRARVIAAPGGVHRVFSYVERGFYAAQVRRALGLFPREQIFFGRTDRLWSEPPLTLGTVQDFLGVPRQEINERSYVTPVMTWSQDAMPAPARATLDTMYAGDIRETATLTGLDLAGWLAPDYREPMAPGRGKD